MDDEFKTKTELSKGGGDIKGPPTTCGFDYPQFKPGDIVSCCIKKQSKGDGYYVILGFDGFLKTTKEYTPGDEVIARVERQTDRRIYLRDFK